jgi:flagellar biosynthesis/type III secretory pathway chaperone
MTELRQDADNTANALDAFSDAGVWAPRLRRLLTEQEELYESLERLAKGQSALIADGDAPGLLSILAERQTVLTALQRSNDEMAPFRERWNDLMQELPDAERGTLADRVESIAMRIERIAASDEADREALTARRVEVSDRLTDVTRSKSAVSAYGNPQARGPRFQDREG